MTDQTTTPEGTPEPIIEPAAPDAPQTAVAPRPRAEAAGGYWWGTGRRKASVARVRVRPGTGQITVNEKPYTEFFRLERDQNDVLAVLKKTSTTSSVDVNVRVHGGGTTGQAGAIVLGIARALNRFDPNLEPILRDNQFLSRDPRRVERKKYGQPGARRRFQFSKR